MCSLILQVLTKVELEQLLFDIQLFREVKNGKVCINTFILTLLFFMNR